MNSAAEKIIDRLDNIIEDGEQLLLRSIAASEDEIYNALIKILRKYSNGDKLSSSEVSQAFLNRIDSEIEAVLRKVGYYDDVANFLVNFDLIDGNVRKLHKAVNNLTIESALTNPFKKLAIDFTTQNLRSSGISSSFIQPIKEIIVRHVVLGGSLANAEIELSQKVRGIKGGSQGTLQRYVGQVARDGLSQFDGTIQTVIKNRYRLTKINYIGSIVEGTRGQCYKWVNMGVIEESNLQAEIDWVESNIGSTYSGRRISGWIPETTVDNFLINRGGFRCRHRGIATRD